MNVRSLRILGSQQTATRTIAIATIVGLALRFAFALVFWVGKPLTHDEREYLALARSLSIGQGFRYLAAPQPDLDLERFGRAPLYPWVLSKIGGQALLDTAPSSVPRSIKIGQSFIGAAAIPVLAAIAWRAAGPPAGAAAAILTAVYPPFVWSSAYALSETPYLTLAWLSVLLLGAVIDRRSPILPARGVSLTVAAGAIGGLAALTRPAMIVFLALTPAWLALARRSRLAMAFLLATIIVIAPWTARNLREYKRFVLIASEGGITFWTGNHRLARGEGDMAANPAIKRANQDLRLSHPGLSSEELEPIYYRDAIGYLVAHPVWWVGLLGRKAFYLLVPLGPSYTTHSLLYRLATTLSYVVLLPFALVGARTLRRTGTPVMSLWLFFVSALLVSLIFFPQERFRISAIDPTIVICVAVCAARLESRDETVRHWD